MSISGRTGGNVISRSESVLSRSARGMEGGRVSNDSEADGKESTDFPIHYRPCGLVELPTLRT